MSTSPEEFRVGVLGKGTVGGAFAQLLVAHSDRIQRITGLTPRLSGVLSRSSGDFGEIRSSNHGSECRLSRPE